MSDSQDDLEELREEKMQELRERKQQESGDAEAQEARRQQAEAQKKAVLRQHLTDGARKRLNSVKMSKPEFGEQAEQQIVAIAQRGQLGEKIDEEKMKALLKELKPDDKSFNVRRR
ncbi:DNA-binding protein [Halorubellus sp. JP-L1]|uniref:DNA-binding protein n=1 Tax=Halorubellus sp. JP-L1 TaxID=2715753 RepID=UPI00140AEF1B|nr:DNA-binding protein [Halorubellus sp. JP-L1]NHN42047.1 DNA-binding protein [Halorubellus sp. JP-L1]